MAGTNVFAVEPVAGIATALTDENGFGYIIKRSITLTSAQILALFTTPITVIPAAGAGTVIVVNKLVAKLPYVSTTYAGANALEVRYTNAAGAKATADLPTSFLNSASTAYYKAIEASVAPVENSPVVVAIPTANPTVGNSTIVLEIEYAVRKLS